MDHSDWLENEATNRHNGLTIEEALALEMQRLLCKHPESERRFNLCHGTYECRLCTATLLTFNVPLSDREKRERSN